MSAERFLPWTTRILWAVLPLAAGPAVAAALAERSRLVQLTGSGGAWAGWAAVLVATLVAHPLALTVLRIGAPAALAAPVAAAAAGAGARDALLAAAPGVAVTVAAFLPETAMRFVNGPAYANERRFPLRPPGLLLVGPLPLAWLAVVGLPASGALLLASRRWAAGGAVLLAGLAAAVTLGRSMHLLARRWLVFVPAGVVVHDPLTLADPVLFRRQDIRSFDLAPADTDAEDVTAGAPGMAIELAVHEPALVAFAGRRGRSPEARRVRALLVTPTRPGAVLRAAAERRLR